MEIINRGTYYMKIMTAYIVNTESADDTDANLMRVQVCIPEIQPRFEL